MSKVKYAVEVDATVCSELSQMRKCHETRDYSMLPALIERVQYHANQMEAGLWSRVNYHKSLLSLFKKLDDGEISEEDFVNQTRELLDGKDW